MEPRISLITLGVADLERATHFYEECLGLPRLQTPPSTAIFELGKTWLALWPRESLAADAGLAPEGSGFRGFALAHNVRSPAEVDALLAHAAACGGTVTRPGRPTDLGRLLRLFLRSRRLRLGSRAQPGLPSCLSRRQWP